MIRVLLFTSQDIGNDILEFLADHDQVELHVVTQRTARDEIYGYRSTYEYSRERRVPVMTPKRLDDEFLSEVEALQPDLIVCAYFPHIFPKRLIDLPPRGCINVHPGALPQYRGTFPLPWCILNEEASLGVTVHVMDEGIDTGPILKQAFYPISDDETGHGLYMRAMKLSANLLIEVFDDIVSGKLKPIAQAPGGSYYNKIEHQYQINWHNHRRLIRNQIRVHAIPYFPAYSFLINKCVIINRAELYDLEGFKAKFAGRIMKVFDDRTFAVSCVDGCLHIKEYDMFPKLRSDDYELHIRVGNQFSSK